ncbi:sphingosine 1-phosphate receptor 2-like [Protopterus annectens]|uniref:sphingosine 1-phosphate receptor 2-like n=1 Tax=Protopterus annectens TaxID=7888 RepID=UPI001CFA5E8B|nr:sphingosine 1-phosphate receptor 2-like [Protopterus annectens]XP_043940607.1 sphingosine 1-phosphate receptor 2-like [Protopterus annectens]XP_043940608.1 sphingosine 1-phosphate receptor 2-like [Protopterus annectens]
MGTINDKYFRNDTVYHHYNYTKDLSHDKKYLERSSPPAINIVFIIVCCIIILENILVLLAIWRNKKFHTAMFLFLGNLAFSDLLAGSAYIANILFSGHRTLTLTPFQWFFREGTAFTALSASVFSLFAIAIERHVAITKVKVYSSDKNCRMILLIGTCWMTSLMIGGLPILGWNCIDSIKLCSTVLPLYSKYYILFVVTVFTITLIAIVVLYVRIYCIVKSSHGEVAAPQTLALLKTVTIVLGVFIMCWLPAFIILLLDVSCAHRSCNILYKADYFFAVATLNSAMNPLIYTFSSREMRREFLRLLCCWGVTQRNRLHDRCLAQLRSSSSLERCTHKYEPTSPIMADYTTCV